jgi:peptide/nickel transport system permease protein
MTHAPATLPAQLARPRRRRIADPGGWAICGATILFVAIVVAAEFLTPYSPTDIVGAARSAPSLDHLMGTDQLGRDVLARTLFGGQQTLLMATGSTALAAVIGIPLGIFAGYFGRWQAGITMRVMDVLLAFPGLLFGLIIITVLGSGVGSTILAVGIAFIPIFARMVYGITQRVRAEEYISAAQVVGCSPARIMLRHVLPVVGTQIIVLISSAIGWTTLLCAALSFLGFGVQAPSPEWGADLGTGTKFLNQAWWMSVGPGIALSLTIFLSNFLGDYLAKRLDAQPVVSAETAVAK